LQEGDLTVCAIAIQKRYGYLLPITYRKSENVIFTATECRSGYNEHYWFRFALDGWGRLDYDREPQSFPNSHMIAFSYRDDDENCPQRKSHARREMRFCSDIEFDPTRGEGFGFHEVNKGSDAEWMALRHAIELKTEQDGFGVVCSFGSQATRSLSECSTDLLWRFMTLWDASSPEWCRIRQKEDFYTLRAERESKQVRQSKHGDKISRAVKQLKPIAAAITIGEFTCK
jgi:hypothetical protein